MRLTFIFDRFRSLSLLLILCFTCTVQAQQQPVKPLILLISIDGFRADYIQRGFSPNLLHLAQNGAHAKGLISSFPSVTFPNHYSMVTGKYPDHHGIVNNWMIDPLLPQQIFKLSAKEAVSNPFWWSDAEPIWVSLSRQGKISSTLFWPGTEAKISGIQPRDWLVYNDRLSSSQRVEKLLNWLSRPDNDRADFATLYFSEVDHFGHEYGPDSEEVNKSLTRIDNAIRQLIEGLDGLQLLKLTTMIIVSDHGMTSLSDQRIILLDQVMKKFPNIEPQWIGPVAGLDFKNEDPQKVLQSLEDIQNMKCWPKDKIPAKYKLGSHRRVPKIVCLADLGWTISFKPLAKTIKGNHGFDPEEKDMHGLFIASGKNIRQTKLNFIPNIDIYPLLARMLEIIPVSNDAKDGLFEQIVY